jgi:hypothetical protein
MNSPPCCVQATGCGSIFAAVAMTQAFFRVLMWKGSRLICPTRHAFWQKPFGLKNPSLIWRSRRACYRWNISVLYLPPDRRVYPPLPIESRVPSA